MRKKNMDRLKNSQIFWEKTLFFPLMVISLMAFTGCNKVNNPNIDAGNLPQNNIAQPVNLPPNNQEEETMTISITPKGRSNPFKPYEEKDMSLGSSPILSNVPQPPELVPNEEVESLLSIKISGILYDRENPSALIKVNEQDYLVHKNDRLFEYRIRDITPDKVVVSCGRNIYKVGIGEIVEGQVNINPVNNRWARKPAIAKSNEQNSSGSSNSTETLPDGNSLPSLPELPKLNVK